MTGTADLNVKMGVTGVSQFKSQIKQAEASVKTFDAALKLNEKQYKASGDAEVYMQNKINALNGEIAAQKVAVEAAEKALAQMSENGVDKSSIAFQNMQQKLLNSQSALLTMQVELSNVGNEAGDVGSKADAMGERLDDLATHSDFKAIEEGIGTISGAMDGAIRKVADFGQKMWETMVDSAAWSDDLATRATMYGVSVEDLQRMEMVADKIDTPVEAIIKARKKLAQGMVYGSDDVKSAFGILGVHWEDDLKNLRDAEDVFWEVGDGLKLMANETERDATAQKLLGRSWDELKPLFEAGRTKYEEELAKQTVVPQENIDKLNALDDAIQDMNNKFETLSGNISSGLAPAFQTIADSVTTLVDKFNEYLQTDEGKAMMDSLNEALTTLFSTVTDIDPNSVIQFVTDALGKLTGAFQWITDNKDVVVAAIGAIGAAFVGLKLTSGALKILDLINGIKGLTAGTIATEGIASAGTAVGTTLGSSIAAGVATAAPWLAAVLGGVPIADLIFNENSGLKPTETIPELQEKVSEANVDLWNPENVKRGFGNLGAILFGNDEPEIPAEIEPDMEQLQTELDKEKVTIPGEIIYFDVDPSEPTASPGERYRRNRSTIPGHSNASGLDYVPYNGYYTVLHKGESVLNRADADAYRRGGFGRGDAERMLDMMLSGLSQISVSMDSQTVGTLVAPSVSEMIASQIGGAW